MRYELSRLAGLHGVTITGAGDWSHPPREVELIADPDPAVLGEYVLELQYAWDAVHLQGGYRG